MTNTDRDLTVEPIQPILLGFEPSGSMGDPEPPVHKEFFLHDIKGGTNFPNMHDLVVQVARSYHGDFDLWNRYIFHVTDGEADFAIPAGPPSQPEPGGS